MNQKLLVEKSAAAPVKSGTRWRAVLATPGQGSSGFYSEDVLREYGPAALAPGAKAFVEHDPARKVRDMIGTYPDGAFYEDGVGLVGELEVFPHWKEFIEAVGPHSGLSIYMLGEADKDGNVTKLTPDIQNGVDLVSFPGLAGSGLAEKLYESAKASAQAENGSASAATDANKKEAKAMDEADKAFIEALFSKVDEKIVALESKVDSIVTLSEASKDAEAEKVDALEAADKLVKSELTEAGRKRVLESVKSGTDLDDAIKTETALRAEILAEANLTPTGRVVEGSADADFQISGWGA